MIQKYIASRKIRFLLVGGIGALIEVALFELFFSIKLTIYLSNFLAFNIAFLTCYIMHHNYTHKKPFEGARAKIEGFIKYATLMYAQYAVGTDILVLMINYLEINTLISKVMQIAIVVPIGYIIQKKIFKSKRVII